MNKLRTIAWMVISILSVIMSGTTSGQIIGDSIVRFSNNWQKGDSVYYESIRYKQRVINGDTITDEVSSLARTKIQLYDVCNNGDKVFKISTEVPDKFIRYLGKKEVFRPYYEAVIQLSERPLLFLTNKDGAIKDMMEYGNLIIEIDSLDRLLLTCAAKLDWEVDIKDRLIDSARTQLRKSMSKQSIIEQCQLLQLYGEEIPIGSTLMNTKESISFLDNIDIETNTECNCEILLREPNCELVRIVYTTIINSDQMISAIMRTFSDSTNSRFPPDTVYPGIVKINTFLIDLSSSTLFEVVSKTLIFTEEESRIDYSISQIVQN